MPDNLGSDPSSLIDQARNAALRAYAPYSDFSVGCAVESIDGEIAVGSNMENASYRLGVCAELAALTAAKQSFDIGNIARIAVAGGRISDGVLTGEAIVTPCGGCRQSIMELAQLVEHHIEVISASGDGKSFISNSIYELLPHGFTL